MKPALQLWSWEGVVSRRAYLVAGLVLFAVKYPLDWLVSLSFDRPWNVLMYLSPRVSPLLKLADHPAYWMALVAVALPFVAAGTALSARRLRDMGVHPFWAGLFFLPFLNLAFFLVLAAAPSRESPRHVEGSPYRDTQTPLAPPALLLRAIPKGAATAFLFGVTVSCLVGFFSVLVTRVSGVFGVGIFIGSPFAMGLIGGFCAGVRHEAFPWVRTVLAGLVPLAVALVLLLAFGVEGVACVLMAAPILVPLNVLGATAAWAITRPEKRFPAAANVFALPVLLLLTLGSPRAPDATQVTSETTVAAPPEQVWKALLTPGIIDAPVDSIFAIAPMPLATGGEGAGKRDLRFTVGTFAHVVTTLQDGRSLLFRVEQQPANLDRYVAIHESEVTLVPLADGSTTVVTTTRYDVMVHPAAYWSAWTNAFIGASQARVLEHVRRTATGTGAPAIATPDTLRSWMSTSNATCNCTRHAP